MKLAVVSDIHGNLEALDVVLADIAATGVEAIACLGDFVGYGGAPNECIERLRPLIDVAVVGNHDLAACGRIRLGDFNTDAATAARWTEQQLSEAHRAWLASLPLEAGWRGAHLVHASPLEPGTWHYVLSPQDAEEEMDACHEPMCFIGHSHFPGTFTHDGHRVRYTREPDVPIAPAQRYLVNVASVGQPRDGDPRTGWLLWEDERIRHVRLEYDVEAAMRRIRDAGLPAFLAERLQWGE